jgi:hypothetical protein
MSAPTRAGACRTLSSWRVIRTVVALFAGLLPLARLTCRSRWHLAAENLFLRTQLAFYLAQGPAQARE